MKTHAGMISFGSQIFGFIVRRRGFVKSYQPPSVEVSPFGQLKSLMVAVVTSSTTIARFNMPGTPWVLLCSKKAQELIDLHHECNVVVLLDPVWNPAHREQRIGRVHRAGSRFKEIHVIDSYTEETYDEYIYNRAMKRSKMMAILLGAGHWLDQDREISNVSQYQIDLSPRSRLEHELAKLDRNYLSHH